MKHLVVSVMLASTCVAHGDSPPVESSTAHPKAITKAWLREILRKKGALAQSIDRTSGLVSIGYEMDTPSQSSAGRLCGDELKKSWPDFEKGLRYDITHSDGFVCHNAPGPPLCAFGLIHAADSTITYVLFRAVADGTLRLDAILLSNGPPRPTDKASVALEERYVQQQLTNLRRRDCDANAVTPSDSYKAFRFEYFEPEMGEDKHR